MNSCHVHNTVMYTVNNLVLQSSGMSLKMYFQCISLKITHFRLSKVETYANTEKVTKTSVCQY